MKPAAEALGRLVAYVFSASGSRRIREEDWVRIVSLERKWLPPSKARLAADAARRAGLLRNAGAEHYEMGLEAEGWPLPVDYRPDPKELDEALADGVPAAASGLPLFRRIVRSVSEQTGQGEAEIVAKINQSPLSGQGLIRAEVAALAYARVLGIDVSAFWDEVEATLRLKPVQGQK